MNRTSIVLSVLCSLFGLGSAQFPEILQAEESRPLYQQEPFDWIKLDESNKQAVLRVQPLALPKRKLPVNPDPDSELQLRLLDRPDQLFRLKWKYISELRLFEQQVLSEADALVASGQLIEAFPYYRFLEKNHGELAGLSESIQKYLQASAAAAFRQQRLDEAVGLLWELHARNPTRAGLATAADRMVDALLVQRLANNDYAAARGLIGQYERRFGNSSRPLATRYRNQLSTQAAAILAQARAMFARGETAAAYDQCWQGLIIYPQLPGLQELAREVHARHPRVRVGVTRAELRPGEQFSNSDWDSIRRQRLTARRVVELVDVTTDGPVFRSPLGELVRSPDGKQFELRIEADLQWNGARPVQPADVVRLAARANAPHRGIDNGMPLSMAVLLACTPLETDRVRFQFDRSLLDSGVLSDWVVELGPAERRGLSAERTRSESDINRLSIAPYVWARSDTKGSRFARRERMQSGNERPRDAAEQPPREVVEVAFTDPAVAVRALKNGEIDVLDRVHPAYAVSLAAESNLRVVACPAPTVHLLIANPARPWTRHRAGRAAVAHAIDRQQLLDREVLQGQKGSGAVLLPLSFLSFSSSSSLQTLQSSGSTPFSKMSREFDRSLAKALFAACMVESDAGSSRPQQPPTNGPELTLAYWPSTIATAVCSAIKDELQQVGWTIRLKAQTESDSGASSQHDLLYVEHLVRDPARDALRLMSQFASVDPVLQGALNQLATAEDQVASAAALSAIERVALSESYVIPLFKITEHFAIHQNIEGVGQRPVTLYQSIDHWRVPLRFPGKPSAIKE